MNQLIGLKDFLSNENMITLYPSQVAKKGNVSAC